MNGLHLDLKWPMYKPAYFRHILRTARSLGIDTILLEFENKILIDWLKQAIHPDHWTPNDVRNFVRLAKQYGLTVIPKVPLMGHMEWVLQWPWWAHLQENNDRREVCPRHPDTPAFVRRLPGSVRNLFPDARMIHIGGDESFSLATCPRCRTSGLAKGEIYLNHYLPLIQQVQVAGKRPMIYGDMILAHPEIIERVPRSTIICDWDYWSGSASARNIWGYKNIEPGDSWAKVPAPYRQFKKYFVQSPDNLTEFPYLAFLKDKGFDVVAFSAARSAGDNYCAPRTRVHVANAMSAAKRAKELGLMGTLVTSWAVRFNHFETNWPAIAASAWTWQNPTLTFAKISRRFAAEWFGTDWPELFDDLNLLSPELPDLHSYAADPFPPDIVHSCLKNLYANPAGPHSKTIGERLSVVAKSFQKGLTHLQRRSAKITRNNDMYQHWLLAAETLVCKAQVLPALIKLVRGQKVSNTTRDTLQAKMRQLIARYRKIFGATMLPVSLAMEIDLRFGESLELLRS